MNINGVLYNIYSNGTVTYKNGTVIVKEGGQKALYKFLGIEVSPVEGASQANINGVTYWVLKNGTVYDGEGNVIVNEGGVQAVVDLISYNVYDTGKI